MIITQISKLTLVSIQSRLQTTALIILASGLWGAPVRARGDDSLDNVIADPIVIANPVVDVVAEVVRFPHEITPLRWKIAESVPELLTRPNEPLGKLLERLTCAEHDHISSGLDEHAIGIQSGPDRPPLLLEWNEKFLSPGWLKQGVEIPTGAIWRPAFWVFGEYRTAFQYFDRGAPAAEWANRLDLFGQLNLSGTERVLIGMRPLDDVQGNSRVFSGYDFKDGRSIDAWNADFQTLFFEGDFGEIFPRLDPHDTRSLDYGFSVGRMPLLAQQGLLINEDAIDAMTVTRNSLSGNGNLNFRSTGVFAWNEVGRNSSQGLANASDPGSKMVALLTESDFAVRTINLDAAYVYGDNRFGNMFGLGASAIRRHHGFHNTYNTSIHLLASIPEGAETDYAGQGELLFAQTSWTPHHTEDLIYFNGFWAIDQFTSPTRGEVAGNALGQTGVLFGAVGLGQSGAPIDVRTEDVAGSSLGYQWFFDHTRQQVIWEVGGFKETKGDNRGAIGTAMRFQKAIGQHSICVIDGFVSKHESRNVSQGTRFEWRVKF